MNFQQVEQANGQMVTMNGVVTEIGVSKLTQKQKPCQTVKIQDANFVTKSITIHKGNGELIPQERLGQTLSFNLSTYDGQHGKAISGFWNHTAQAAPLSSQPASQQPQQAAGQANARNKANGQPDWDAIAESKVRDTIVCAAITAGQIVLNPKNLLGSILYYQQFIMTGKAPIPPAKALNETQQALGVEESEPPFDERN